MEKFLKELNKYGNNVVVFLDGVSGCGKTTHLRLLERQFPVYFTDYYEFVQKYPEDKNNFHRYIYDFYKGELYQGQKLLADSTYVFMDRAPHLPQVVYTAITKAREAFFDRDYSTLETEKLGKALIKKYIEENFKERYDTFKAWCNFKRVIVLFIPHKDQKIPVLARMIERKNGLDWLHLTYIEWQIYAFRILYILLKARGESVELLDMNGDYYY